MADEAVVLFFFRFRRSFVCRGKLGKWEVPILHPVVTQNSQIFSVVTASFLSCVSLVHLRSAQGGDRAILSVSLSLFPVPLSWLPVPVTFQVSTGFLARCPCSPSLMASARSNKMS